MTNIMLFMTYLRAALEPLLPAFFFQPVFLELALWHWVMLFFATIIAYFLSLACARVLVFVAKRIFAESIKNFDTQSLNRTYRPLQLLFLVLFVALAIPTLDISETASTKASKLLELIALFSFSWLSFRIFDVVMAWLSQSVIEKGRTSIHTAIILLRRVGKTVIGLLASLVLLQSSGVQVATLITALGVGGLAFALAIQRPLQDLLGGLSIILDQPISVGQECKFGSQQGIVEDIGLISTRIRTLERTVLAVPNLELSKMQLENLSLRDRIRFTTTFGLRFETSPEQLRYVLIEIRKILYAHPKIDKDPARVRLINFATQSLEIEIVAYVLTSSWSEHLAVKEDILLRIMELIRTSGTAFAVPSQINYASDHQFLDNDLKSQVETKISDIRRNHELPLPEFSDGQILALDDTLDYPPKGSANSAPEGRYL